MWMILFKEFFQDLRRQKLRSGLTVLAICWGTVAVVCLLGFGEGLSEKMLEGLRGGGQQMMMVYGGQTSKAWEGLDTGRRIRFTEEDVDMIRQTVPYIELITPQYQRSVSLRSGEVQTNTHMEGVNPAFEEMRSMYPVAGGRFINDRDVAERRRVVFLGQEIAGQLFPGQDPIGKTLTLDRLPFNVVGVMQEKMQTTMNNGPDSRRAIIPYSTFREIYQHRFLSSVLIRPSDPAHYPFLETRIREFMARKYRFDPGDSQALQVWNYAEMERIQRQVSTGVALFLFGVGFFTLMIAGVGVANIMVVVVRERTREIGLKKAMGAKNRHIMAQFVFEALLICLAGGCMGVMISASIIFGVQGMSLKGQVADFLGHPVLSGSALMMSMAVLGVIGLLAGFFPARRAARVHPVQSLRYE